ncbi:hypothetical protein [Desulfogranum mediterraneum]|uniref:hypothetical protein n=1 Tax=Desulfogranum mediterraneum TaxID=160661 RepID=UPI000428EF96|nr:hypothetical protein [Desulfogranum mediterraneum]
MTLLVDVAKKLDHFTLEVCLCCPAGTLTATAGWAWSSRSIPSFPTSRFAKTWPLQPGIRRASIPCCSALRSLGEVGMTLMLGGNVIGRTNTLSLEIYNAVFNGEFERATLLTLIIGAISISMFTVLKKIADQ